MALSDEELSAIQKPVLSVKRKTVVSVFDHIYGLAVSRFKKGKHSPAISVEMSWLIFLLIYLPSTLPATTIVGIWTENQITIAADSTQTIMRGQVVVGSGKVCKLYQSGDFIMAVAGLAQAEETNVISEIQDFRREYTSADGQKLPLLRFSIAAQLVLSKVLQTRLKAAGRDQFDPAGFDPTISISLLIAGIVDGNLAMSRSDVILRLPPGLTQTVKTLLAVR
jgi:hypothetical protein